MIVRRIDRSAPERGFTLLEIIVALTVLAVVVMFVYEVLQNAVRGEDMIRKGLRAPKIQNAILGQIFKDFRYLYWDGFVGDAGFLAKNHKVGGKNGDSVDFVTARPSLTAQLDADNVRDAVPSPITEVGYAVRMSDEDSNFLELWRREDWFVDDNPVRGGKYTLIYNRITDFNLQYFPIPEENVDTNGKGVDEWDTRVKHKLPYAIVLDIKFFVDDEPDAADKRLREDQEERIRRIILLKGAYNVVRQQAPGQGKPP